MSRCRGERGHSTGWRNTSAARAPQRGGPQSGAPQGEQSNGPPGWLLQHGAAASGVCLEMIPGGQSGRYQSGEPSGASRAWRMLKERVSGGTGGWTRTAADPFRAGGSFGSSTTEVRAAMELALENGTGGEDHQKSPHRTKDQRSLLINSLSADDLSGDFFSGHFSGAQRDRSATCQPMRADVSAGPSGLRRPWAQALRGKDGNYATLDDDERRSLVLFEATTGAASDDEMENSVSSIVKSSCT